MWLRSGPIGDGGRNPSSGGGLMRGRRDLRGDSEQILTGTLPTELGTLTALTWMCVRHPPPLPERVRCHRAERGGVEVQVAIRSHSHGDTAHRAGHHERAEIAVRAPPSPTRAWTRAPSPG